MKNNSSKMLKTSIAVKKKNDKAKSEIPDVVVIGYPDPNYKTRTLYYRQSEFKEIKGVNDLPKELANVPFLVEVKDQSGEIKKSYQMEFWAGFMGLSQDKKTYSVKPEIGWAVNLKAETLK